MTRYFLFLLFYRKKKLLNIFFRLYDVDYNYLHYEEFIFEISKEFFFLLKTQ